MESCKYYLTGLQWQTLVNTSSINGERIISGPAGQLLSYQEGLCSMELAGSKYALFVLYEFFYPYRENIG